MPQAIDPYYFKSRLREEAQQRQLTTGRGLSQAETEAILASELGERYRGRQRGRALQLQERALDIREEAIASETEAARVSGAAQLGAVGIYGATKAYPAIKGLFAPAAEGAIPTAAGAGAALPTVGAQVPAWAPTTAGVPGVVAPTAPADVAATTVPGAPGLVQTVALPVGAGVGTYYGMQAMGANQELSAAASGAVTGAMIGSAVPVVGTAIGAVVGAGVGLVTETLDDATVICTELHRQGYIPRHILNWENKYRRAFISKSAYQGYRYLADPIIPLMQKSWLITQVVRPFGVGIAYEMAHRVNPNIQGSLLGRLVLRIGLPICSMVNRRAGHGILRSTG